MNGSDRLLGQGKTLVRAIEALETIEPSGPIESAITWLLLKAYRRRLRAMVATAPGGGVGGDPQCQRAYRG